MDGVGRFRGFNSVWKRVDRPIEPGTKSAAVTRRGGPERFVDRLISRNTVVAQLSWHKQIRYFMDQSIT